MTLKNKLTEMAKKHKTFDSFEKEVEEIGSKEFGIIYNIISDRLLKETFKSK